MTEISHIYKGLIEHTGGRDPIKECVERMKGMGKEELSKLVLIAANKLGEAVKGGCYDNTTDAVKHFCIGIDRIMSSYDEAIINSKTNTTFHGQA